MKTRFYTIDEIKKLKNNFFIDDIKHKRELVYNPVFKLWTIMMKLEFPEFSAREIFTRAGIDVNILNRNLPHRRIKEWFDNYKQFGVGYFISDSNYYHTINKVAEEPVELCKFKTQLLSYILKRLRFHEKNR